MSMSIPINSKRKRSPSEDQLPTNTPQRKKWMQELSETNHTGTPSSRASTSSLSVVFRLSDEDLRCARIQIISTKDENGKLVDVVIPSTDSTPSIRKDFENRNTFCFQRIIMPPIVSQEWPGNMFDWNSKERWSQSENLHLFSTRSSGTLFLSPRPDFSISFTRNSLTGEDVDDPVPPDLEECLSPEGSHRCFPFLFLETNHKEADPILAFRTNLGTTALALKNIYEFMVRAEREEDFFKDVRVYSFVLNPGSLNLREHRAEKQPDGEIVFKFQQLLDLSPYTKSQANLLSKKIVTEYAAKKLHPLLFTTFKIVREQTAQQIKYLREVSRR